MVMVQSPRLTNFVQSHINKLHRRKRLVNFNRSNVQPLRHMLQQTSNLARYAGVLKMSLAHLFDQLNELLRLLHFLAFFFCVWDCFWIGKTVVILCKFCTHRNSSSSKEPGTSIEFNPVENGTMISFTSPLHNSSSTTFQSRMM